jgi:hypothetical protein
LAQQAADPTLDICHFPASSGPIVPPTLKIYFRTAINLVFPLRCLW